MTTSLPTAAGFHLVGDVTTQIIAPPVPTHGMAFAVAQFPGQRGAARMALVGCAVGRELNQYRGQTADQWWALIKTCEDSTSSINDIAAAASC